MGFGVAAFWGNPVGYSAESSLPRWLTPAPTALPVTLMAALAALPATFKGVVMRAQEVSPERRVRARQSLTIMGALMVTTVS